MELKAFVHYNCELDKFDIVAWLEDSGAILTTGLSAMDAQLYDKDGVQLGYSETGVIPASIGIYDFPTIQNPNFIVNGTTYLLRLETMYSGSEVSTFIPFTITNLT